MALHLVEPVHFAAGLLDPTSIREIPGGPDLAAAVLKKIGVQAQDPTGLPIGIIGLGRPAEDLAGGGFGTVVAEGIIFGPDGLGHGRLESP